MTNDYEIMSALAEHSKHSLEILNFDQGPLLTSSAVPLHSYQEFEKMTNIVLSVSQLVERSTYRPAQIRYTEDSSMDPEETDFGVTDWVDLLIFLPT